MKVSYTPKSVVERQLLVALESDAEKCAVLCSKQDIEILIDSVEGKSFKHGKEAASFGRDLRTLYKAMFGESYEH